MTISTGQAPAPTDGIHLSVGWCVVQAAEALAASSVPQERRAGKALRSCEVLGLDRAPIDERKRGTQGLRITMGAYSEDDKGAVLACEDAVRHGLAEAIGLWSETMQLDVRTLEGDLWLGLSRPPVLGGTRRRLDRYLTQEVLDELAKRHGLADWGYLAERPGEVRILLRRLRYRLGDDYGASERRRNYAYWTTPMTHEWARQGGHSLNYLVSRLSHYSDTLTGGNADPAPNVDVAYWGEVDTETDPIRVCEVTTRTGVTSRDVGEVLALAGQQLRVCGAISVGSDKIRPVKPFIAALKKLLRDPQQLRSTDVLLVHRGGGVNPSTRWGDSNVSDSERKELLEACTSLRDAGLEVVVAFGHANISVLHSPESSTRQLPLGLFEATTPTAGAAWILQEHVNPRLVNRGVSYAQEPLA